MEDISRELEREIARIKPRPHKTRKENNILIINDFGEIRSGAFLKVLVYFFGEISLAKRDWVLLLFIGFIPKRIIKLFN